jgi:hypothetical protein
VQILTATKQKWSILGRGRRGGNHRSPKRTTVIRQPQLQIMDTRVSRITVMGMDMGMGTEERRRVLLGCWYVRLPVLYTLPLPLSACLYISLCVKCVCPSCVFVSLSTLLLFLFLFHSHAHPIPSQLVPSPIISSTSFTLFNPYSFFSSSYSPHMSHFLLTSRLLHLPSSYPLLILPSFLIHCRVGRE